MDLGGFTQEALDFTRCVRPDGSAYGTAGTCRKGVEQELKKLDKRLAELRWNRSGIDKERMLSQINARKRQLKKEEQKANYKSPEVDYDAASMGPNAYKAQLKLAIINDGILKEAYGKLREAKIKGDSEAVKKIEEGIKERMVGVKSMFDRQVAKSRAMKATVARHKREMLSNKSTKSFWD